MALVIACALIVAFFLVEGRLRADDRARSFKRGRHDKQSTTYLFRAFYVMGFALIGGGLLTANGVAALPGPSWLAWLGTALTAAGIWLRLYANQILGPYFTRTLKVKSGQPVVQHGPYRVIRHPGYLGIISMWMGSGLATMNALALAFVSLLVVGVYVYRIHAGQEHCRLPQVPGTHLAAVAVRLLGGCLAGVTLLQQFVRVGAHGQQGDG